MPSLQGFIDMLTEKVKTQWERYIAASDVPGWWKRSVLIDGGGLLIRKTSEGSEVYYSNSGKYDYMDVIERGRGAYDMKPALLSGSRAMMGANGRYVIVPLTRNKGGKKVSAKNNEINSTISKIGSKTVMNANGQPIIKNVYKYMKRKGDTGAGNVFRSEQKQKGGSVHKSYTKFVVVSEKSSGWIYPAIKAGHYTEQIQKDIDRAMKSKALKNAVLADIALLKDGIIKKYGKR